MSVCFMCVGESEVSSLLLAERETHFFSQDLSFLCINCSYFSFLYSTLCVSPSPVSLATFPFCSYCIFYTFHIRSSSFFVYIHIELKEREGPEAKNTLSIYFYVGYIFSKHWSNMKMEHERQIFTTCKGAKCAIREATAADLSQIYRFVKSLANVRELSLSLTHTLYCKLLLSVFSLSLSLSLSLFSFLTPHTHAHTRA